MKPPIYAILATFLLTPPAMAAPSANGNPANNSQPATAGEHLQSSTGREGPQGEQPAPHIYQKGDHLSPAYGAFSVVGDWQMHKLMAPPAMEHWVRYGNNFLLVRVDNGLITDIVKAEG